MQGVDEHPTCNANGLLDVVVVLLFAVWPRSVPLLEHDHDPRHGLKEWFVGVRPQQRQVLSPVGRGVALPRSWSVPLPLQLGGFLA